MHELIGCDSELHGVTSACPENIGIKVFASYIYLITSEPIFFGQLSIMCR